MPLRVCALQRGMEPTSDRSASSPDTTGLLILFWNPQGAASPLCSQQWLNSKALSHSQTLGRTLGNTSRSTETEKDKVPLPAGGSFKRV